MMYVNENLINFAAGTCQLINSENAQRLQCSQANLYDTVVSI